MFVRAFDCSARTQGLRLIPSATRAFYNPALLFKKWHKHVPLITLDFNHTLFHGAAGAACGFKHFGVGFEFFLIHGNAGNQRDSLSLAPLGLAANPNDTVTFRALSLTAGAA